MLFFYLALLVTVIQATSPKAMIMKRVESIMQRCPTVIIEYDDEGASRSSSSEQVIKTSICTVRILGKPTGNGGFIEALRLSNPKDILSALGSVPFMDPPMKVSYNNGRSVIPNSVYCRQSDGRADPVKLFRSIQDAVLLTRNNWLWQLKDDPEGFVKRAMVNSLTGWSGELVSHAEGLWEDFEFLRGLVQLAYTGFIQSSGFRSFFASGPSSDLMSIIMQRADRDACLYKLLTDMHPLMVHQAVGLNRNAMSLLLDILIGSSQHHRQFDYVTVESVYTPNDLVKQMLISCVLNRLTCVKVSDRLFRVMIPWIRYSHAPQKIIRQAWLIDWTVQGAATDLENHLGKGRKLHPSESLFFKKVCVAYSRLYKTFPCPKLTDPEDTWDRWIVMMSKPKRMSAKL